MIKEIAFLPILGLPLVVWGGIKTFILVLATAMIPMLNQKKITKIPMKYHVWLARIAIVVGLLHGLLAALAFWGF